MSEKLYSLLLRFYPSRFRKQYGAEAMQVFRDRLRDERGLRNRARLWLDVLRDLMVSAPREHSRVAALPTRSTSGVPSFLVLEEEPLRPDMFLLGAVLALVALGTFGYLLTHGGNRVRFPGMVNQPMRSAVAPAAEARGIQQRPVPNAGRDATQVLLVSDAERALVLRKVIGAVRAYDPDQAEGRGMAQLLEEQERGGDYAGILQGPVLAALLTRTINGLTRHVRVTVLCGPQPGTESSIWVAPSHRGGRAWLRIDEHFSVVVEAANR